MRNILIILSIGLLAICSCKTPQQKLSKLVDRYPALMRDTTIIDYDTTIVDIPAVHSDSVIHINTFKSDTFIMTKENLRVQTIYRNDSVFITGDCFGITDTIVSVEEIRTKYIVNQEESFKWERWLLLGFVIFMVYKEYMSFKRRKTDV